MGTERRRATVLGFTLAVGILAVLAYYAGVDELVEYLRTADLRLVAGVFALTLGWLAAWGLALRTVLGVLGVSMRPLRAFLVVSGAMFANNVTPFGQAGGEPVTALLIAERTDVAYERGLAAIASVDSLNFVPSVALALAGLGYFATEVAFGRSLTVATAAVVTLAVAVPLAAGLAWRHRAGLVTRVAAVVTPVVRRVAAVLPRVTVPEDDAVRSRAESFLATLERVAADRRGLAAALGFSALGWACQMVALWLAFRAIGAPVPLAVAVAVVPVGAVAGVTPLPGGAGGIESVLVALLLAAPVGLSQSAALAGVVVFRGFVYWVPVALGGAVVSLSGVRSAAT